MRATQAVTGDANLESIPRDDDKAGEEEGDFE